MFSLANMRGQEHVQGTFQPVKRVGPFTPFTAKAYNAQTLGASYQFGTHYQSKIFA